MARRRALPSSQALDRLPAGGYLEALCRYSEVRILHLNTGINSQILTVTFCRLVDDLGLHSTLTEYKVPREDLPQIAQLAVGAQDDPLLPKVVALLESLYA